MLRIIICYLFWKILIWAKVKKPFWHLSHLYRENKFATKSQKTSAEFFFSRNALQTTIHSQTQIWFWQIHFGKITPINSSAHHLSHTKSTLWIFSLLFFEIWVSSFLNNLCRKDMAFKESECNAEISRLLLLFRYNLQALLQGRGVAFSKSENYP